MNFDFTEDQHEIKRTARDLLAKRSTFEKVREHAEAGTYDGGLWKELAGLGWPGIAVAEEHGGQGLGVVELAILCEELGYACAATPFLGTATAALAIEAAGSDDQKAAWLPKLAAGEARGALGLAGQLIPDAAGADVVVVAEDGGLRLAGGGDVEAVDAIDPTRRHGKVAGGAGEPLGGDAAAALDRALVAVAAELVGVSQRALDMTVAYVKDRKQFETPVGAYQAVSHRCAQMLLHTEGARSATYFGAWAADAEPERLPEAAAIAKAAASEAGKEVTASAIQAHGGIGFTWEADVHWLYKRAQLDAQLLGGARTHRAAVARLLAGRLCPRPSWQECASTASCSSRCCCSPRR
ncbi:MAG: acyl-CoA/acyl-ACP dehydrogenase [Solirubrobacterales bacterium]|nr:acyl-CoA/acyl-ACP dehydrogenase [Solirubrobacterales bacterium]